MWVLIDRARKEEISQGGLVTYNGPSVVNPLFCLQNEGGAGGDDHP